MDGIQIRQIQYSGRCGHSRINISSHTGKNERCNTTTIVRSWIPVPRFREDRFRGNDGLCALSFPRKRESIQCAFPLRLLLSHLFSTRAFPGYCVFYVFVHLSPRKVFWLREDAQGDGQ